MDLDDETEAPPVIKPVFKKKVAKKSLRRKFDDDDVDEETVKRDDNDKNTKFKAKFIKQKVYKATTSAGTRPEYTPLELDDDPENNPVIENAFNLELVLNAIPTPHQHGNEIYATNPSTIPNTFLIDPDPLSKRQIANQYRDEYADKYNYDDGTENTKEDREEAADFYVSDEEPIVPTTGVDWEMYDMDLGADDVEEPTEEPFKVISLDDQIAQMAEQIESLLVAVETKEKNIQFLDSQLQLIRERKDHLVEELNV